MLGMGTGMPKNTWGIRKPVGIGYSIIKHYNLNNVYNIYYSDVANDNAIYNMIALVNFTISVRISRITNHGIQCQLHIIQYLTIQDWWVTVTNKKHDSLLQCLTLLSLSALILSNFSYFSTYYVLLNFVLVNLDSFLI
jgi:hypothetical protein